MKGRKEAEETLFTERKGVMPVHTILIKPVSGLCNLHCDYCFYCDEMEKRDNAFYGKMSEETLEKLIRRALHQAQGEICFAFQGGEPLLRGIEFYEKALKMEKRFNRNRVPIMNTIQTNGMELNEEWCRLFRDHDFLIGVSVDGLEETHNQYRHDSQGGKTYKKVRENIRLLDSYGVDYNILTVVTSSVAEHIEEIYREYAGNGWKYQQYIACLDPLGEIPGKQDYSLMPEKYGEFLIKLFRLWDKDWKKNRAPYIRQFENYIGILMGYKPEACEQRGQCSVQCVAEADGSAYPCDFYVLEEYCLGNYGTDSVEKMLSSENARKFLEDSPDRSGCEGCEWRLLCRGGCRRHWIREETEGRDYNYFCKGYKMFFEKCSKRMKEIAQYARFIKI